MAEILVYHANQVEQPMRLKLGISEPRTRGGEWGCAARKEEDLSTKPARQSNCSSSFPLCSSSMMCSCGSSRESQRNKNYLEGIDGDGASLETEVYKRQARSPAVPVHPSACKSTNLQVRASVAPQDAMHSSMAVDGCLGLFHHVVRAPTKTPP